MEELLKCENCKKEGTEEEIKRRKFKHPKINAPVISRQELCDKCAEKVKTIFNS